MNRRNFLFAVAVSTWLAPMACAQTAKPQGANAPINAATPTARKLLVVSTTAGFRHSTIELAEKKLADVAAADGRWTLDYLPQPDDKDLARALLKLAPAELAPYDGVIFLSTTGELPLPDRDGFLDWIAGGKAFIGIHAATDTFHQWPAYQAMIGAQFARHGKQTGATIRVVEPNHPATRGLGETWKLEREELYQFKNYAAQNNELLVLDRDPETGEAGHFPLAWTKNYQKGRVFYSALGHRDDLWDDDPARKNRVNSPLVSRQFLAHLQGGIAWALGFAEAEKL